MTKEQLIARLESIKRYDPYVDDPGCDCCGTSVQMEECNYGDWLSHGSILDLIEELKNGN